MASYFKLHMCYPNGRIEEIDEMFKTARDAFDYGQNKSLILKDSMVVMMNQKANHHSQFTKYKMVFHASVTIAGVNYLLTKNNGLKAVFL